MCRYDSIYVFGYENMRNERFKEFRESLKDSCRHVLSSALALPSAHRPAQSLTSVCGRFCLGSNKVMQVALGKDAETEIQDGLAELATRISGSVGLLFTSMAQQEVRSCCRP